MKQETLPKPTARYRPVAENALLGGLTESAWKAKNGRIETLREEMGVGEAIAAMLESLFPVADMEVLARYHSTEKTSHVTAMVYDSATRRWETHVRVSLPREVRTPKYNTVVGCLYAGGPEGGEGNRVPKETLPFFTEAAEAIRAFKREYRRALEWPRAHKKTTGDWPLWSEIEAEFPVIGAYIAKLREG